MSKRNFHIQAEALFIPWEMFLLAKFAASSDSSTWKSQNFTKICNKLHCFIPIPSLSILAQVKAQPKNNKNQASTSCQLLNQSNLNLNLKYKEKKMGIARRELLDLIKERWNDLFSDFVHYNHSWKRFHLIITIMIQKSRREENHEKARIHLQTTITTKRWKILTNLERDWSVLRPDKRLKQVCCRYNKSNSLQNLRRQI